MYWNDKPYHSLDYEMKQRFGTKVYKIALDGGMTCPNRDGTLGNRGCIFCSEGGSGDFAARMKPDPDSHQSLPLTSSLTPLFRQTDAEQYLIDKQSRFIYTQAAARSVSRQITEAAARIQRKLGNAPASYIAYFQSYTNTYAPVSYLREIFTAAILHPDVRVLSIATRPDCLSEEVLTLCEELNQIKPVWLELGLQTVHEGSARFIRRGYELPVFEDALTRIHTHGLETIVHVILGLPGESREHMLQTISWLAHHTPSIQGIKLQLLHILKGTDLGQMYEKDPDSVPTLDMETYLDLVIDCIALLPPEMIIHRITGDGPKSLLLAPLWSADKRRVLNSMTRRFKERGICQGDLIHQSRVTVPSSSYDTPKEMLFMY